MRGLRGIGLILAKSLLQRIPAAGDRMQVLALLEPAFNHAVRTMPRPSSGMVEMQEWFAKLRK